MDRQRAAASPWSRPGVWLAVGGIAGFVGLLLWGTNAVIQSLQAPAGARPAAVSAATSSDPYRVGLTAHQQGDYVAAVAAWNKIAAFDARAQAGLGDIYYQGDAGVERDVATALALYYKASTTGLTHAEVALGRIYAEDKGVKPDFAVSGFWYRNAGMHGIADAAYIAGTYSETGRGIRLDLIEAATWFNLAAELGHAAAGAERDRIVATLTPSQRTILAQRIAEFHEERRTGTATRVGTPQPRGQT